MEYPVGWMLPHLFRNEGDAHECKRYIYLNAILHYNLFINYNNFVINYKIKKHLNQRG